MTPQSWAFIIRLVMPAAELPTCVFCGQSIGPGEATAGRAPMAAHAACADAALADDSHWDAISSADGEPQESAESGAPRRSAGCLAIAAVITGLVLRGVALRRRT